MMSTNILAGPLHSLVERYINQSVIAVYMYINDIIVYVYVCTYYNVHVQYMYIHVHNVVSVCTGHRCLCAEYVSSCAICNDIMQMCLYQKYCTLIFNIW